MIASSPNAAIRYCLTIALNTLHKHTIAERLTSYWPLALPFLIGLVLRLSDLAEHSLLFDEAFVAVGARDIAINHTPMWDAISNAPFVWIIAQIIRLAHSDSAFTLRVGAAVVGSATIIPLYYLGLRLFGRRTAILAAFLFAIHPFAIAFSRVLFADPFQVFFVVSGWLAIDKYALATADGNRKDSRALLLLLVIWALAFLMKYNAIVHGALWVIAGTAAGRYRLRPALISLTLISAGAIFTLLLWPYDAPVWLLAFLEKSGQYDLIAANHYFQDKLHLLLYGVTEIAIIAGLIIAYFKRISPGHALGTVSLFVLFYLVTVIFLGRTFQRYLLAELPVATLLLASLTGYAWDIVRTQRTRWKGIVAGILLCTTAILYVIGMVRSADSYLEYLHNDIDQNAFAGQVKQIEQYGKRGFWFVPEPIAAYYLGFTQHYSRALKTEVDTPFAALNYFEYTAVPYSEERDSYSVLEVRRMLRSRGLWSAMTSPMSFYAEAKQVKERTPAATTGFADYLVSPLVRSGDLLLAQTGVRDIQGEPILETVNARSGPPQVSSLPLRDFNIVRIFRPADERPVHDTTIDPQRAAGWILSKK